VNSVHAIESALSLGRTGPHLIRISTQDVEDRCILSIEDTGCGISEKNMKNLFKPFFTTKEIGLGTGLGLATSYRIVESWGGKVQVESQEGIGTIFKISFPK
jgi:signal transduction histidine kinase